MMEDRLMFDLDPRQVKYREILDKEFLELEMWAISDIDPNRNKTHFSLESLQETLPRVKNKPIVGFFERDDFGSHDGKVSYDNDLGMAYWDTTYGERILGVIRESDPVEIVTDNAGLNWLKVRCVLWTSYCYKQVKRMLKDRSKKVSVEITVHEKEVRPDGIEEIKRFTLNGITILGSKNGKAVLEAIPGAHASILEQLDEAVLGNQRQVLSFAYNRFEDSSENGEADNNIENQNSSEKEEYAEIEHQKLETKIWNVLSSHTLDLDNGITLRRYLLNAICDHSIEVIDNLDGQKYRILYEVIDDDQIILHMNEPQSLTDVDDIDSDNYYSEKFESNAKIIIDKSKESVSNRAWGSIDKNALRRRVVKAENFKTAAKSIFLDLREGWEDGELTKLKYPVMCLEANKAVYNRGALASAKAYAEKNGEQKILMKINKIYKYLGLNNEDNEEKEACYSVHDVNELYVDSISTENRMEETVVESVQTEEVESEVVTETVENYESNEETVETVEETVEETVVETVEETDQYAAETATEDSASIEAEPVSAEPEVNASEEYTVNTEETCACEEKCEESEEGSEDETPVDEEGCDDEECPECKAKDEELCKLQADCDSLKSENENLKSICEEKDREIEELRRKCSTCEELQAKCDQYADYEEIKHRMEVAEASVFATRCEKMKNFAIAKMANEKINSNDRERIENAAGEGKYSCEDEIINDIAIAIYKSRPAQTERFSTVINNVETENKTIKSNMSVSERIAARYGNK